MSAFTTSCPFASYIPVFSVFFLYRIYKKRGLTVVILLKNLYNKGYRRVGCTMTRIEDVCFLQEGTMCFGDLYVENGFIERIDYKTPKPLANIAIQGFVDIHTHGFRGIACENENPKELRLLADAYAKRGIVGFAATLDPISFPACERIIQAYREAFQGEYTGARFYGLHLEGPYLNPQEANDLDPAALQAIDLVELEDFLNKHGDIIRIMSIAPELENGQEAVKMLHRFGIHASLAHTRASYEAVCEGIENGLSQVTHICNAMEDLNHHKATALDAILASKLLCEVNMDGVHIQKHMLKWLLPLLGSDRVIAISDGSSYSGFEYPDGYQLDGCHVVHHNAIYCHGHLSSSFKDLLDAFQYLYKELQYPLEDCIKMTSMNAGYVLQTLNYEIGLGKKADLVILDHNAELKDVIIQGRHAL